MLSLTILVCDIAPRLLVLAILSLFQSDFVCFQDAVDDRNFVPLDLILLHPQCGTSRVEG